MNTKQKLPKLVESRFFASVAEAVAHYYKLGFATFDCGDNWRTMRKDNQEVLIHHRGMLQVTASLIEDFI